MAVAEVLAHLIEEQADLDTLVAPLDEDAWKTPTPSPGWTIADQIAHLTYFDATAALAIRDEDAFRDHRATLQSLMAEPERFDSETMAPLRSLTAEGLLGEWRSNRAALALVANSLSDDSRIEWYGPSMGARSFLTARLMEAWAHGQDIADTIGATRKPTDRLRHIAQLGVITRGWSYVNRGMEVPSLPVSVVLDAPSGDVWQWQHDDATASVRGSAVDFCLVVTQRRHVDDTSLVTEGDLAREWMVLAQAFAGGATDGPAAGTWAEVN